MLRLSLRPQHGRCFQAGTVYTALTLTLSEASWLSRHLCYRAGQHLGAAPQPAQRCTQERHAPHREPPKTTVSPKVTKDTFATKSPSDTTARMDSGSAAKLQSAAHVLSLGKCFELGLNGYGQKVLMVQAHVLPAVVDVHSHIALPDCRSSSSVPCPKSASCSACSTTQQVRDWDATGIALLSAAQGVLLQRSPSS